MGLRPVGADERAADRVWSDGEDRLDVLGRRRRADGEGDDRRDAGGAHQFGRVLLELPLAEVADPGEHFFIQDIVRFHHEAHLARRARHIADLVEVLQHGTVLRNEALRIRLDGDIPVGHEADNDERDADRYDRQQPPVCRRGEGSHQVLHLQPLRRSGGALPRLAMAVTVVEQAGGQEDAGGGEDDDADSQHRSEVADHRHAGDVERQKARRRCDDGDAERRPQAGQRVLEAGKRAAAALGLLFKPAVHLDREVHAQSD